VSPDLVLGTRVSDAGRDSPNAGSAHPVVAELYEEHFDLVWRSLRRLGVEPSQLEDAVQDVFVVVQRRLDEFEHRSSSQTWLFGIALRVAKAYRRRAKKRGLELTPLEDELQDIRARPDQAALDAEAAAIVQHVLNGMDESRRAIFVLAEFEDFTAQEIAQTLDVGVNTVYSRLRLAKRDVEAGLRRLRARGIWRPND
jgi:RNA polymerase sigma-70 factor, ECF subfamily